MAEPPPPNFSEFGAFAEPDPFKRRVPAQRNKKRRVTRQQWTVAIGFVVGTLTSLAAWAVSNVGLGETGLYFIAIPGACAAALALLPTSDATTSTFGPIHVTFLVILGSALVLREGVICMIMASPIILLVVGLVNMQLQPPDRMRMPALIPLLLILGAAEGVVFDLPTHAVAVEERVVPFSADAIAVSLGSDPELPDIEPLLFRLPFPKPSSITSEGIEVGDRQVTTIGDGRLVLEVVVSEQGRVRWIPVEDTSAINRWYPINHIEVMWSELPDGTHLHVAVDYDRKLAPAVYFDPLGRFGLGEFAEVLADLVETNA